MSFIFRTSKNVSNISPSLNRFKYAQNALAFLHASGSRQMHHGFRHRIAQAHAMKKGRFTGKSARFGL